MSRKLVILLIFLLFAEKKNNKFSEFPSQLLKKPTFQAKKNGDC
jgi:hypothetical protein